MGSRHAGMAFRHAATVAARARTSVRLVLPLLVLAVLAVCSSGCGASSDSAAAAAGDQTPRRGGTVWMETAQEPPILNSYLAAGGMSITDVVTTPMRSTWITIDDHGRWAPLLATSVPTVANGGVTRRPDGGMQVDFHIQPAAVWSDGVPITCSDLAFTWKTVMDPRWSIGSRIGWELVDHVECPTPKQARIVMREAFAPYLTTLLATSPLPRHELAGKDFNTVWNNRITVSSGPFIFEKWDRGDRLTLRRNPRWWRAGSERKPYLDHVVIRFVPDSSTLKLDLRMGDADVVGIPPDTNLPAELAAIPTAQFAVKPGAGWENLTFNTRRFPFDDARVRRAAAFAIDRNALVDVVLKKQVPRLDSTLLPYQAPYYRPSFGTYHRDQGEVDRRMRAAGWTRGEHDRWTDRDGRVAKVLITTMSGNPIRLKAVQLVAAQLDAAGFAAEILLVKPEVFFGSIVAKGSFDLALYSFTQGLDPSQSKLFSCSQIAKAPTWAGKNNAKYCRPDLDVLLAQADRELDVHRRADITHDIDELLVTDLPTLPLYEQPDTLAWSRRLHGVRPNAMGHHLWNLDEWWLAR